jgi:sugar phosphate isomerase/epimerase
MKYGSMTSPFNDLISDISAISRLDFDFVELGIEGPTGDLRLVEKKKDKIKQLLKNFNTAAITHTSWWMELGSSYEVVRNAWLDEFERIIRVSSQLGIEKVNTHSHSEGIFIGGSKNDKRLIQNNFVKSLRSAVKYADQFDIKIILENAGETGEITKFQDFSYIVRKVPRLGVHLDIGHAFIHGGMKNVEEFMTFGNRIEHIHIHDNHGKKDEHLPLGRGAINFFKIAHLLKEIKYDKTMTFEVFTKNRKDTALSREKFKKLWVNV